MSATKLEASRSDLPSTSSLGTRASAPRPCCPIIGRFCGQAYWEDSDQLPDTVRMA